jgi:hypothetical protein
VDICGNKLGRMNVERTNAELSDVTHPYEDAALSR